MSFSIIYQDSNYVVLNKAPGIAVHATVDKSRENLLDLLKEHFGPQIFLHHRLDKDTSGAIAFTLNKNASSAFHQQMLDQKIEKIYRALLKSTLIPNNGILEDFLKKERIQKIEKMVTVSSGGLKAITHYQTLERVKKYSEAELSLVTGRMHQIRVQTSSRGCPVLGDSLYGDQNTNRNTQAPRLMLHAYQLKFFDPLTNVWIEALAPLPEDYLNLKNQLFSTHSTTQS